MLFPKVDDTITDPNDYALWEKLISAMVEALQEQEIQASEYYWEVANEPDIGEQGGCPYKFTPEGYARYYKHTARRHSQGGPGCKGRRTGSGEPELGDLSGVATRVPDGSSAAGLRFVAHLQSTVRRTFARRSSKKRAAPRFQHLHPETILDEWNMSLRNTEVDPRFQPAFVAETAWQMFDAGLDYSCYYHIRDYHVRLEQFQPFMSPRGAAEMAWWWNRKPQYDGLFDYQNHVRPAYFTFLLLSRLTGQRLEVSSSDKRVHGFATWDPDIRKYSVLFWNFSPETCASTRES